MLALCYQHDNILIAVVRTGKYNRGHTICPLHRLFHTLCESPSHRAHKPFMVTRTGGGCPKRHPQPPPGYVIATATVRGSSSFSITEVPASTIVRTVS